MGTQEAKAVVGRVGHVLDLQRQGEPFVYIGRAMPRYGLPASKWANPYRIGPNCTREQAIKQYFEYLQRRPDLMDALPELRGKVLACWCKTSPDVPCHGELLVSMANREPHHD